MSRKQIAPWLQATQRRLLDIGLHHDAIVRERQQPRRARRHNVEQQQCAALDVDESEVHPVLVRDDRVRVECLPLLLAPDLLHHQPTTVLEGGLGLLVRHAVGCPAAGRGGVAEGEVGRGSGKELDDHEPGRSSLGQDPRGGEAGVVDGGQQFDPAGLCAAHEQRAGAGVGADGDDEVSIRVGAFDARLAVVGDVPGDAKRGEDGRRGQGDGVLESAWEVAGVDELRDPVEHRPPGRRARRAGDDGRHGESAQARCGGLHGLGEGARCGSPGDGGTSERGRRAGTGADDGGHGGAGG